MKFLNTLILVIILGCNKLKNNYQDIKKYPEIVPFVLDSTSFDGYHDYDNAIIQFSYKINPKKYDILVYMDSVAFSNNWVIKRSKKLERVYTKYISSFPADNFVDTLFVSTDTTKNLLKFLWK